MNKLRKKFVWMKCEPGKQSLPDTNVGVGTELIAWRRM